MSEHTPDPDEEAQLDALYHRLARRPAEGPSEATRRAILSGARQIARARGERGWPAWLRRLRDSCGRPAVFGTLAAGIVAALLLVPLRELPSESPELALTREVAVDIRAQSAPGAELKKTEAPADALVPAPVNSPVPPAQHKRDDAQLPTPALEEAVVARQGTARLPAPAPAAVAGAAAAPLAARAAAASGVQGGMAADGMLGGAPGRRAAAAAPIAATPAEAGSQLRRAAAAGDPAQLGLLIRAQAPLDEPDARGRTALMLAVMARAPDCVRLLLEAGADPNRTDTEGLRALELAAGDPAILQLLREHGAH